MFINYNGFHGVLTVDIDPHYTDHSGAVDDIIELVSAVKSGLCSSCHVEGALYALEDGSLWEDDQQEVIEKVYDFLLENGY